MVWLGLLLIGIGIVQLAFPQIYRGLSKFGNDLEGVKTEQGYTFEMGRIFGAGAAIVAGIIIMTLG